MVRLVVTERCQARIPGRRLLLRMLYDEFVK